MSPGDATTPGTPRAGAQAILLIIGLGLLCYANSFAVPFHFDDHVVIVGEPAITGFQPYPFSRRFLGDLSFAVTWRLFGERVAGHHAVNLAVHLANALLVWHLARLLWRTQALSSSRLAPHAPRISLLAALLFVAHPLQTQAVTYIVQRYASLTALFFLASACSYVSFRLAAPGRSRLAWHLLFLASGAAACWTKENALALPLAIGAVEWTFFVAPLRRRALYLSPFLAALAAAFVLVLASGIDLARLDSLTRVDTAMPRADYLLTQARVVASYLRLLLLPLGQNLDHDVAISTSLAHPAVLLAAALHAGLLVSAVLAIRSWSRAEPAWRVAGFGVIWFYVTLLVESSFIPIVDVMYEHRAYLPSAGLFLAAATGFAALRPLAPPRRWNAAVVLLVATLAALTIARNRVWRDDLSLWADSASKSPNKARPLNNLGVALFLRGDFAGAAARFERARSVDPSYSKAWFNLGEARQRLGDCAGAIEPYESFLRLHPAYPDTYRNLAECYDLLGDPARARALRDALQRRQVGGDAVPLPNFYR
jgi:tetratricopeptide (TPR) repeat protein